MTLLAEQYSVTEAIIWYSILVVTIIIFILYLKFYGHAKKDIINCKQSLDVK